MNLVWHMAGFEGTTEPCGLTHILWLSWTKVFMSYSSLKKYKSFYIWTQSITFKARWHCSATQAILTCFQVGREASCRGITGGPVPHSDWSWGEPWAEAFRHILLHPRAAWKGTMAGRVAKRPAFKHIQVRFFFFFFFFFFFLLSKRALLWIFVPHNGGCGLWCCM